jgi:hypothetical protein
MLFDECKRQISAKTDSDNSSRRDSILYQQA